MEKKQTKERNEREELFFEDLNFFRFPPFLTPLFSNLFRFFSLSVGRTTKKDDFFESHKKLTVSPPIFPLNHDSLSLSSFGLCAFGVFTRGGRAKNNE